VRVVLAVTLVYFLAYGPLEPAPPVYSRDVLDAGTGGYGLLWSAFGAGALAGLATIPLVGRLRPGIALAGNALTWGAALLPLLVVTGIAPAMLALAAGGLIWAPYVTLEASLLQRLVPAHLLGRVFGVRRAVSAAAVPLGAAAGGLLLDHLPSTTVIGASAVLCMLGGAAASASPPSTASRPGRAGRPRPSAVDSRRRAGRSWPRVGSPGGCFTGNIGRASPKRESGANPELPRSGKWERTPSPRRRQRLGPALSQTVREATAGRNPVRHARRPPTSPKTCQRPRGSAARPGLVGGL
jgi:MFS family permease